VTERNRLQRRKLPRALTIGFPTGAQERIRRGRGKTLYQNTKRGKKIVISTARVAWRSRRSAIREEGSWGGVPAAEILADAGASITACLDKGSKGRKTPNLTDPVQQVSLNVWSLRTLHTTLGPPYSNNIHKGKLRRKFDDHSPCPSTGPAGHKFNTHPKHALFRRNRNT